MAKKQALDYTYQASLWGAPPPPLPSLVPIRSSTPVDGLRGYQCSGLAGIARQWGTGRKNSLLVMATGTGKTQTFCGLAWQFLRDGLAEKHGLVKRVLVIAPRGELVDQAANRWRQMTGEAFGIERAGQYASRSDEFVVATVQTIMRDGRLNQWPADHFGLVIFDECHNALAAQFKKPLERFRAGGAKILGVTATPDREDEQSLGKQFGDGPGNDEPAFVYDITDAIDDGYLVPMKGKRVHVEAFDISGCRTVHGDLSDTDLDEVVCGAIAGVCDEILLELGDSKRCVAFFPKVKSAELAAQRLNALVPGIAVAVSGKTPATERAELIRGCRQGKHRILCNCDVATEGFDWPEIDVVAMARPTKSRRIYAQSAGRGARVLPGTVDHIKGDSPEAAAARRAAIARSDKPHCVLLDFVGNCGKHNLQSPEDVMSGSYSSEEVELSKEITAEKQALEEKKPKAERESVDALESLKEARRRLAELAKALKLKTKAERTAFDPFTVVGDDWDEASKYGRFSSPITGAQKKSLLKIGLLDGELDGMSKAAAGRLLDALKKRQEAGLGSYKGTRLLNKFGFTNPNYTREQTGAAVSYIMGCLKATPKRWVDKSVVATILGES